MGNLCEGRVAIVTGAGRGIGREHAIMLASQGAKVVVNDLGGDMDGSGSDLSPAQEVVNEIVEMGGEAIVNGANVADFTAAGEMVQQAIDTWGRLDILINNAGILRDRMIFSMSEDDFDAVINVHLKGTFSTVHHASVFWRETVKAGGEAFGRIINISSVNGQAGQYGQVNYCAAKAGIIGMTKAIAQEGARHNITANTVAPGYVDTEMVSAVPQNVLDKIISTIPVGRLGHPQEIARAVAFLAREDSQFVTGSTISINGGHHMY